MSEEMTQSSEMTQSVDIWNELEEASDAVETWPQWQRQYEADVYHEVASPRPPLSSRA